MKINQFLYNIKYYIKMQNYKTCIINLLLLLYTHSQIQFVLVHIP